MAEKDSGGRRLYATRYRATGHGPRNALAQVFSRWRTGSASSLNSPPSSLVGLDTLANSADSGGTSLPLSGGI